MLAQEFQQPISSLVKSCENIFNAYFLRSPPDRMARGLTSLCMLKTKIIHRHERLVSFLRSFKRELEIFEGDGKENASK